MKWISDSEEFCRALGITKVITKCIVSFWKLLIHVTFFFFPTNPVKLSTSFIYCAYHQSWLIPWGRSILITREYSTILWRVNSLALISSSALFQWFYIIFAYVNLSGIGMHFIIIYILAWVQLDICRFVYNLKSVLRPILLGLHPVCILLSIVCHFIMKNYSIVCPFLLIH